MPEETHRIPIRLAIYRLIPKSLAYGSVTKVRGRDDGVSSLGNNYAQPTLAAHRHTTGYGTSIRVRSRVSIEQGESLLNVLRYVERNALRANLVDRPQD